MHLDELSGLLGKDAWKMGNRVKAVGCIKGMENANLFHIACSRAVSVFLGLEVYALVCEK